MSVRTEHRLPDRSVPGVASHERNKIKLHWIAWHTTADRSGCSTQSSLVRLVRDTPAERCREGCWLRATGVLCRAPLKQGELASIGLTRVTDALIDAMPKYPGLGAQVNFRGASTPVCGRVLSDRV